MAITSRYLTVTQGNLDHSHLYLTEALDMFPEDVLGGPDERQAAPRTVTILWGDESVDTDVVRDKNIFRRRGWVRRFFDNNRIGAGDRVLLEQLEPYRYRVSKLEEASSPACSPNPSTLSPPQS